MEKIPSREVNNHSASKDILCCTLNPKVQYHVYNSLLQVHFLSQRNSLHTVPPAVCNIHFNIIT
jgi:hypothetical protein